MAIVACREKEGGETNAESKHLTVWVFVRNYLGHSFLVRL